MRDTLLRVLKDLAGLQLVVAEALAEEAPVPLEIPELQELPDAPKLELPKGVRRVFLAGGHHAPNEVKEALADAGYPPERIVGGIAFKKGHITRLQAWESARRAWKHLKAQGVVPPASYNTLRKAHCADWYVWVHDPNMETKKWVQERIQERRSQETS
jgi:hypothetical protein